MEYVTTFLESSTIHGLAYIATGRNYVRIFWILVVIAGFIAAGGLICESFQSWHESPVKTTIETLPITEITFPKVTVCPPKNTFTDLNSDLMMTENMTLDNDTRKELTNYAVQLLYDYLYDSLIANVSKLEDNDRYYNWYHGYTQIVVPFYDDWHGVTYYAETAATSGTISTQHFGDRFDADKLETKLFFSIDVYTPESARNNPNVTLHFEIEMVSLEDLSSGQDKFVVRGMGRTQSSHNLTPPTQGDYYQFLDREAIPADVRKQKLDVMPGFRVRWWYSGMDVEPEAKYYNGLNNDKYVAEHKSGEGGHLF